MSGRRLWIGLAATTWLIAGPTLGDSVERVRHRLSIEIDPQSHQLVVEDVVTLPSAFDNQPEFLLNSAFSILGSTPTLERLPAEEIDSFYSINAGPDLVSGLELARYRLAERPADGIVRVRYTGTVDFGLSDQKEEYTRGFRETAGIVGEEGVYLAGNGFWYPFFGDDLVEFTLDASVPTGWHLISQGNGTSRGHDGRARWDSGGGVDEIFLVGGPLELFSDSAGVVEAQVFLRERDEALAAKYLEATARYIEMYRGLLGPYPYGKFALVENFWETGYGMPSFTLLGPQVIRFPFIINSSYPHEILHNWWGNSVFVDFSGGNWCEGLTAYLADHLIQEQRGAGSEYRRSTLQKYASYVQGGEDFPLTEFRSRHSAATEAVGYGKTLMVFHMLRRQIGDEAFAQALARFYRRHKGERAGFDDLRTAFEESSGVELRRFFAEWVEEPGALLLDLEIARVEQSSDGAWRIHGFLRQQQKGTIYELSVPAVVQTAGESVEVSIPIADAGGKFSLEVAERPLAVHVDPQFDLFRVLDPRELPPSIGQIFGDPEILAVLPDSGTGEEIAGYEALVEGWRSDSHEITIVRDSEIDTLPAGRSIWILGRSNRYAGEVRETTAGVSAFGERIVLGDQEVEWTDHSVVVVRRHPESPTKAIGWLVVEPVDAFAGMGRKLPHYGKYSYLAFEGDEPTNVVKGQWDAADSPLFRDLRADEERAAALPPARLAERSALAELPPTFSEKALMEHVAFLAAPDLGGRVPGSEGAERAASHIIEAFRGAGLDDAAGDGSYRQEFELPVGPDGTAVRGVNVVAVLPGGKEEWKDQAVVVSAHYDHLGYGWPDVHQGDEGTVHPGADDNASGVAVLIELSKAMAAGEAPFRTLVFVAFSGEEAERAGSRHFVESSLPETITDIRAAVNLDTVGRLGEGSVQILGTGTADEWQHIFRGASWVTGVPSRNVPGSAEASDQMSFIEKGIPGVQLFTGAHEDYHRPGDTAAKVDGAGLVKVATLAKEAVVYLAGREEPLTVTISDAQAEKPTAASSGGPPVGRKVRIGTIPDFAFQGPGVRVDSVGSGSPAEKAGIRAGDVLLRIDEQSIEDLRGYSDALRALEAGQEVSVLVLRDGEKIVLPVSVEAR